MFTGEFQGILPILTFEMPPSSIQGHPLQFFQPLSICLVCDHMRFQVQISGLSNALPGISIERSKDLRFSLPQVYSERVTIHAWRLNFPQSQLFQHLSNCRSPIS